jgi:hypothetical protein
MGARWYDPTIGLWTQPDTIVPNPMDPLSLNRFAFVEGNPLKFSDPSGHCPWCLAIAAYTAPEWIPEVAVGAVLAAGALSVAIGQNRQEEAAAVAWVDSQAQTAEAEISLLGVDPLTGEPKKWRQIMSLDHELGGTTGDNLDAHHLIPQEFIHNPVVDRARRLGWQINGKDNGILLPDNEGLAKELGLPAHTGGHSEWNDFVQGELDKISAQGQKEKWSDNDDRWRQAIEDLDQRLRQRISDPDQTPPGAPLQ